jgi:hypothetical protein
MKRNIFFMIIVIISSIILTSGISHAITVIASPNPATVGQNVTVNISASFPPLGAPSCVIQTNFGDRSPVVSVGTCTTSPCNLSTSHTYILPGIYTITAGSLSCTLPPLLPDPATTSITINCAPLTITTTSPLPSGTVGQAYSTQIHTSGGQSPISYSLISGSLPPGLSLSSTGIISGMPTGSGNYSFTIRASDSCTTGAQSIQGIFSVTVNPAPCPVLSIASPSTLSTGTVGQGYSYQLHTSGGQSPVTFSVISGSLPPGLNLNITGFISGTPTAAGNYSFTVRVTDSCAAGAQAVQGTYFIQIQSQAPPPPLPVSLSVNPVPSSFIVPRGQSSSKNIYYQFTGTSSLNATLNSSGGNFIVGSDTIDANPIPVTVTVQNGSGRISEVINIPVRVLERAIQRGSNRFNYIRTFTGANISLTATVNFTITTEAGAEFDIKRIELYFENRRAEITVERSYSNLKAYADIRFVGSGLLHGYWEVDGRVMSHVDQHLTFGRMVTLQTPEIPPLPTFETGTHILRFVITSPVTEIPLPSILYFVTPTEFKGKQFSIKLISPEDEAALKYSPVKFDWEKLSTTTLFLIQYFDDPLSKPIFSAFTREASYGLPEIVLRKIFSPGQKYYWRVEGFDSENNNIGESDVHRFSFK